MRKIIVFLAPILIFTASVFANDADDRAAIEATLADYMEGFFEADSERLNRAFDKDGRLVTMQKSDDGSDTLKAWDMAPMLKAWSKRDPMPMKPKSQILSIDIKNGAMASVVFDSNGRFYDFLTLAKLNGQWKIIHKAFIRQ